MTVSRSGDRPLLERDGEVGELADALARAEAGEGGLVLIEGSPGAGKTRLLGWLGAAAGDAGVQRAQAVGGELEREFPFGVVRQLFEPIVASLDGGERAELLSGAAALAGPLVGVESGQGESVGDASFATLHGLYWLVAGLAERARSS